MGHVYMPALGLGCLYVWRLVWFLGHGWTLPVHGLLLPGVGGGVLALCMAAASAADGLPDGFYMRQARRVRVQAFYIRR